MSKKNFLVITLVGGLIAGVIGFVAADKDETKPEQVLHTSYIGFLVVAKPVPQNSQDSLTQNPDPKELFRVTVMPALIGVRSDGVLVWQEFQQHDTQ